MLLFIAGIPNWLSTFFGWIKDLLVGFVQGFVTLGDGLLQGALDLVGLAMPASSNFDAVSNVINGINYFFPLSETLAFLYILGGLWVSLWVIRALRTLLP